MPLKDDYASERKLKEIAMGLAPAMTQVLNEEEHERYGFILFIVDYTEGLMQYVSDGDPEETLKCVQDWCNRRKVDLENERNSKENKSNIIEP